MLTSCYLVNLMPTLVMNNVSPYETLLLRPFLMDYLKVSWCLCYENVLISFDKFIFKSIPLNIMRYTSIHKGYKWLNAQRIYVVFFLNGMFSRLWCSCLKWFVIITLIDGSIVVLDDDRLQCFIVRMICWVRLRLKLRQPFLY